MADAKRSFSVRIFLPGGEPEGLRVVEKSNWTGQGVVFPRALFGEARQRPELKRTGVYVLWGPSEKAIFPASTLAKATRFSRDSINTPR